MNEVREIRMIVGGDEARGASENIINISIGYASGKEESRMSSDEQCRALMRIAASSADGFAYMFRDAIGTIIDTVDGRLQDAKRSGRPVSKKQMAQYEAEFDTWLSYTADAIMSGRNAQNVERIQDVVYLAEYCASSEWDHAVEGIMEILVRMYEDDVWVGFITDFFEHGMPGEDEADQFGFRLAGEPRYIPIDTPDRISLYIDILERAGSDPGRICKTYWMDDSRICIKYLRRLLKRREGPAAWRVASIGLDLFPDSVELAAEALGAADPADADMMLKARCRMYASSLDPVHYEKARASPHWNGGWARRLAEMLAANEEYDAEMLVLVEAGMHEEALDVLQYNGTMKMAISYRMTLAASHPDRYYEACSALVAGAPKTGRGRTHYAMVRQCLRAMKAVPGHESDFHEMCRSILRDTHTASAEFRRLIKEVAE